MYVCICIPKWNSLTKSLFKKSKTMSEKTKVKESLYRVAKKFENTIVFYVF